LRAATLELFRIEEGEDSSYHGTSKAGTTNRRDLALKVQLKKGGFRRRAFFLLPQLPLLMMMVI
jgi:hypothetical protein